MLAFVSMKDKQTEFENFLTVDEAARLVDRSHWTVRMWLHTSRLTRYHSGSRTLVRRKELLELTKVVPAGSVGPAKGRQTTAAPTPKESRHV